MDRILAQARVYYIFAYGRDSSVYEDKKWVLGYVYFTRDRIVFRYRDRLWEVRYGDIEGIEERDRYSRVSPPMGWSRGSILEIRHYEDASRKHVITTLISADFDTVTKMKAIISRLAFGERRKIGEVHRKVLLLISLGIRNAGVITYLLDLDRENYDSILKDLRLNGLLTESLELTSEGRRILNEIRKSF